VRFHWERLTDNVHRCRLPFLDVTAGLVQGRTGVLLVDTGSTLDQAAAIDADVAEIAGRRVTHVVLTHKHFDHVLGSGIFADTESYCAPAVVECLSSGTDDLRHDAVHYGVGVEEIERAIAALRPADHAVDEAVVDLGNQQVTIAHLGRGHTHADLVVTVPATRGRPVVVFSGDLVEESGDPAIDGDSDVAAWPGTLNRLLAAGGPDARYVPGHGRVVDAKFVRRQRDWLAGRS
jgi:glyoxylase-like metal-dependent hydrolase (beta-lactamase superfamily II)